jgi:O-antigen/teichoic acid export membrane protein
LVTEPTRYTEGDTHTQPTKMLVDTPPKQDPLDAHQVRTAATAGAKSLGVRAVITILISLVSKPILSRLIDPYQTGIFNSATQLTGPLQKVGEGFLGGSLVRQEAPPTDDEYTTVILLQVSFAAIAALGLILVAPVALNQQIAHASNQSAPVAISQVLPVLIVLALSLIVSAVRAAPVVQYERHLQFDKISRIEVIESIVYTVVVIALGFLGLGVWAMTIAFVIRLLTGSILYWTGLGWRPNGKFRWSIARKLATFGVPAQLNAMAPDLGQLWIVTVINLFVGPSGMGFIGQAAGLAGIPMSFTNVLNKVAFSAYSRLGNDQEEQGRSLISTIRLFGTTLSVLVGLFIAIAPFFVPLFLGQRWMPVVPIMQWCCIEVILLTINGVLAQNQNAAGRPTERLVIALIASALRWLIGYPMVLHFGLSGFGPAIVSATLVEVLLSLALVQRNSPGCRTLFREAGLPALTLTLFLIVALLTSKMLGQSKAIFEMLVCGGVFVALVGVYDLATGGTIVRREFVRLIVKLAPSVAARMKLS